MTRWETVAQRVDAMTLRERGFIFATLVLFMVAFVDLVLVEPQLTTIKILTRDAAQHQAETMALRGEVRRLVESRGLDPDKLNRERLARAQARIAEAEERIAQEQTRFTSPEQMRRVLEQMLSRNRRIALLDMKTLSASSAGADAPWIPASTSPTLAALGTEQLASLLPGLRVLGEPAPAKPAAKPPLSKTDEQGRHIYRHGIEFTVAGSYLDLLTYVVELEKLPTQLHWAAAVMSAETYPVVRLKLVVYTLSLDPAWLNV